MTNDSLLAQWRERFADFSRSGLSVTAWCAAHDITVHRYYYWRCRLSDCSTGLVREDLNWLALTVSESPRLPSLPVRVGAAVIDVAAGFDAALLRAVVAALEPDRC